MSHKQVERVLGATRGRPIPQRIRLSAERGEAILHCAAEGVWPRCLFILLQIHIAVQTCDLKSHLFEGVSSTIQDRNLIESSEWRRAIEAVDEAVVEHLRDVGFDEALYGERIGFGKLKWLVARRRPHSWPACSAAAARMLD